MSTSIFANVPNVLHPAKLLSDEELGSLSLEGDALINEADHSSLSIDAMLVLDNALMSLESDLSPEERDIAQGTVDAILADVDNGDEASLEAYEVKTPGPLGRVIQFIAVYTIKVIAWVVQFIGKVFGLDKWKRVKDGWQSLMRHGDTVARIGSGAIPVVKRSSTEDFYSNTPSLEKNSADSVAGWVVVGKDVYWNYPSSVGTLLKSFKSSKKDSTARMAELISMLIRQSDLLAKTTKELSKLPTTSTVSAVESELALYAEPSAIMMNSVSIKDFNEVTKLLTSLAKGDHLPKIVSNVEYNVKKLKEYSEKFKKEQKHAEELGLDQADKASAYQKTFKGALQLGVNILKTAALVQNSMSAMSSASAATIKKD